MSSQEELASILYYIRYGLYATALNACETARNSSQPTIMFWKAFALTRQGSLREAKSILTKLLSDPDANLSAAHLLNDINDAKDRHCLIILPNIYANFTYLSIPVDDVIRTSENKANEEGLYLAGLYMLFVEDFKKANDYSVAIKVFTFFKLSIHPPFLDEKTCREYQSRNPPTRMVCCITTRKNYSWCSIRIT